MDLLISISWFVALGFIIAFVRRTYAEEYSEAYFRAKAALVFGVIAALGSTITAFIRQDYSRAEIYMVLGFIICLLLSIIILSMRKELGYKD